MIPLIARVHFHDQNRWLRFRLWVPLFLLWILLLPVAILLLPFLFIGCLFIDVSAIQVLRVSGGILTALRGTHIEVEEVRQKIMIELI